jgi:CheY-like chemotaxis protein
MMIGHGKRVLVVDDDQDIGCFLVELLESHHFAAVAVADGLEAVRVLHQRHFDVVITDLQMPFLDGIDLLCHCHQRWPGLPVILMSGNLGNIVEPAMAMGASACISKPVDTHNLLHALGQALTHQIDLRPNTGCVFPPSPEGECLWSVESIESAGPGALRQEGEDR